MIFTSDTFSTVETAHAIDTWRSQALRVRIGSFLCMGRRETTKKLRLDQGGGMNALHHTLPQKV